MVGIVWSTCPAAFFEILLDRRSTLCYNLCINRRVSIGSSDSFGFLTSEYARKSQIGYAQSMIMSKAMHSGSKKDKVWRRRVATGQSFAISSSRSTIRFFLCIL